MGVAMVSWLWMSIFIGLPGLPLGVPPQPEDPVMSKVAPEECLFYMSSAGMATADPRSANQTEQLLAEPEVQKMAAEIERAIKTGLAKKMSRPGAMPGVTSDDAALLGKLFITGAKAVYLADLKIQSGGPPQVNAGLVVNLGESADKVKSLLDKFLASAPAHKTESDGATWYEIQPDPTAPIFKLGVKEKYFVLGIGDGEVEAMLKRAHGNPPAWLEKVRKDLPIERRSTVEYLNLGKIRGNFLPLAGPQAALAAETLGLNNVTAFCATTGLGHSGFVSRTLVAIDGRPQGLLGFADAKPLAEADLAALPADATFAAAVRIDPLAVFQQFIGMADKFDPRAKAQILASLMQMQKAIGIKMPEDLLGPLGDTVSIYDSPSEGGLLAGLTAVVNVKDPAKAKTAYGKLMQTMQQELNRPSATNPQFETRPVRPAIEKLEFAGKEIYFFNAPGPNFFIAPAWCLTDDELIIALFPQSIKARLSRDANFPSLAQSPALKQVFAEDGGALAVGYCDTSRLFDHLYPMLLGMVQVMTGQMQREGIDLNVAMLPSAQAIRRHLTPGISTVRRTKEGIEFTSHTPLPGAGLSAAAPLAASALFGFRMAAARPAMMQSAQRAQSMNNMKQIALAMHNYHDAGKSFPPAFKADKEGKPLLSWRVLILPYLEEEDLYRQFKLDEPWDSEHNKKLLDKMPSVYRSPGGKADAGKTNYLGVRGDKAFFTGKEGTKIREITDGTSRTIMTVEAAEEKAVPWTKPDDFEYDENDPLQGLVGLQSSGFLAGFADGSVRFISAMIDKETLKALFTRNGGEAIDANKF